MWHYFTDGLDAGDKFLCVQQKWQKLALKSLYSENDWPRHSFTCLTSSSDIASPVSQCCSIFSVILTDHHCRLLAGMCHWHVFTSQGFFLLLIGTFTSTLSPLACSSELKPGFYAKLPCDNIWFEKHCVIKRWLDLPIMSHVQLWCLHRTVCTLFFS